VQGRQGIGGNRKVIESMPLSSWISFVSDQFQLLMLHLRGKSFQMINTVAEGAVGCNRSLSVAQIFRSTRFCAIQIRY